MLIIITITLSCLFLIVTAIPLVKHPWWGVRAFDFPQLQFFCFGLLCVGLFFCLFPLQSIYLWILFAIVIGALLYHLWIIFPYTEYAKTTVPTWTEKSEISETSGFKILTSNVLMENDDYEGFLKMALDADPDIIFMLETDEKWKENVHDSLNEKYPHQILCPKDNTYGLLFYSRIPLEDAEIRFLVDQKVPSIKTVLILEEGNKVQLYGIHPTPPAPGENDWSTERDAELVLIGREAKNCDLPVMIMGDLNDVAWSHTTRLFIRISELLDPRMGRGFFNTFNAKYLLMRWPLDHVFLSPHFEVKKIGRLDHFHSDHFPIFIELALQSVKQSDEHVESADEEDLEEAQEKVSEAVSGE